MKNNIQSTYQALYSLMVLDRATTDNILHAMQIGFRLSITPSVDIHTGEIQQTDGLLYGTENSTFHYNVGYSDLCCNWPGTDLRNYGLI